jgi:hypothetical protein
MRRTFLTLTRRLVPLMCAAAAACGDQPALTSPSPQPTPAALSPAMRQQLTPLFDLRAAEQFFQTMSQADADRVLAGMGFYAGQPPAETEHVTIPIRSTDPARQDLLDRMWAPYWKQLAAGAVHDTTLPYPGRPIVPATLRSGKQGGRAGYP